jgi:hypothetical protein
MAQAAKVKWPSNEKIMDTNPQIRLEIVSKFAKLFTPLEILL